MALGLGVLALVVFRLIWRALDPPPPAIHNARFDPWLGLAAKAGHGVLYLLLIATPILGIVLQFSRGLPVPVFGIFSIPSPWTLERDFFERIIGMHQFAANALWRRRDRPCRRGALPSLDFARPHVDAHAAGLDRRTHQPPPPPAPAWRARR